MSINFSELIAQLDMPALFTNAVNNSIDLNHGVYPAAMAVDPDPELVYIGHCEEVTELASRFRRCGLPLSFITRDTSEKLQKIAKSAGFNLLCVQSPTAQVYYLTSTILSAAGEISYPNNPLNRFVAEIIEDKIETLLEMTTKSEETGLTFKNRFVVMMIEPEGILTEQLYRQVEMLGMGFATSIYKGKILIFFEAEQTGEDPDFHAEKLTDILTKYNAYAAISTTSTTLSALAVYYQQCCDSIRIGKKLGDVRLDADDISEYTDSADDEDRSFAEERAWSKGKKTETNAQPRIFRNSDYLLYSAIDALAETVRYKHNKITYLTSPLLMKLYRYDKQHGGNLYKVTEAYIESGNSISETSRRLFLHRNTVTNKLAKAEEIMERSFSDVSLCHSLYFSFMIYRYVEKIWGIDADTLIPQPQKMLK